MGFFDFLPCCGPRKEKVSEPAPETASLLPPPRAESVVSADSFAGNGNYGAAAETQGARLTKEQQDRLEAIGREAGSHMLAVQNSSPSQPRTATLQRTRSHSSLSSSRPPSPSPHRPDSSPPGGAMQPSPSPAALAPPEDDGVVRKNLFVGGGPGQGQGNRKASGNGKRGKGKGKGKGKKK
ncbi:hypothetical protein IAT38_002261 [Cryptococcus sp. DSM 104549]